MLHRPFAPQTLLVTTNIIVALRFEVRRQPIHLSNSLMAGDAREGQHSNSGENNQPRNPRASFHFTVLSSSNRVTNDCAVYDAKMRHHVI
ncbi:MAG: hypothetical protein GEU95_20950 [Rhizobiales bacterium]|nr:hypothetical protein [Hyphomicrobiales bacterium]